jgi:capsular polysaccharide transport system permease protein
MKSPRSRNKQLKKMLNSLSVRFRRLGWLFGATVLIPTALAVVYFGFFASDVYVSEAKFVVRSPEKPAATGLGMILKNNGFSGSGDEVYAAQAFVTSRDALQAINAGDAFRKANSRPDISIFNRFNPLGISGSFEDLYDYYLGKLTVEFNSTSSITTLRFRAFAPRDAQAFNERLLSMGEATVNRLNQRGRQDLVRFAQVELDNAKRQARDAALALAAFRNQSGVIDPQEQATVQVQLISKLQDELIASRAQLNQLRAFTPQNPQIPVLQSRISSLDREIADQLGQVVGSQRSLAGSAARYQRLLLESQYADKLLASSFASLEDARNQAARKQAYVERIAQPNLPDAPLEPRRLRGVLATLALGLVAWGILSLLLAGVREHGR